MTYSIARVLLERRHRRAEELAEDVRLADELEAPERPQGDDLHPNGQR